MGSLKAGVVLAGLVLTALVWLVRWHGNISLAAAWILEVVIGVGVVVIVSRAGHRHVRDVNHGGHS